MTIGLSTLRPRNRPSTPARALPSPLSEFFQQRLAAAEAGLRDPFKGITSDGRIEPGLFSIAPTGVLTEPLRRAAEAVLAASSQEQRAALTFPVDSDAWRHWSNIHPFLMRLNYHIGEITGRWDEYGEWLYWLSLMGTPSPDQPWGWQLDGHHLNVNCFVLGDQVVFTPLFMGSEPVLAETGKFAGTRVFEIEERDGLAFMRSLDAEQRARATLDPLPPGELFTAAFHDNFELRYQGLRFGELSDPRQRLLLELIGVYVGRMRADHAAVKLAEVKRHLSGTYFAWMGSCELGSVFYYRINSPVILIEFDHQRGIALDNDEPTRNHIHTVVRTPNGNDYGRDLLRQHHARHHHN